MNWKKNIKRITAVFIILLIVQAGIPFSFRSFVQWFWAALPVLLLAVFWLISDNGKQWKRIMEKLCLLYTVFLLLFFFVVCLFSRLPISGTPDVILVFGAEVRSDGLSPMLQARCDKGFELSKQYPEAILVVSGWKGPGDAMNEGEAMGNYLLGLGLSFDRLRIETSASNTQENIFYSLQWLEGRKTAVVSDDFHLFRIWVLSQYYGIDVMPVTSSFSSLRGIRFWFRELLALGWNFLRIASELLVIEAGHPVK